ncbi:hypothetical protein BD309DRAFT_1058471, partial [Dichomitus squalens]
QILGDFLNWGLLGALTVQVYLYHITFSKDSVGLRVFVYVTYALELAQTILTMAESTFDKFVYKFGDVGNAVQLHITWLTVPVMCGIVAAAVQIFYARRIWVLSRSNFLAAVVIILALMQGSTGVATGVVVGTAIWIWLAGSAAVDVIIAISMTILLLRTKSGIRHSDSMVNALVRLVIESGVLTATIAIVTIVLYAALPGTSYYTCPSAVLAKLYANTMITSLNNRAYIPRSTNYISASCGGSDAMTA